MPPSLRPSLLTEWLVERGIDVTLVATEVYRSPREALVRLYRAFTAAPLARPVL